MRRLQFYSPKAVAQPVEPLETRPGLGDLRIEPVCEVARLLAVVCAQVAEAGQLALAALVQQLGLDAPVGRLHQVPRSEKRRVGQECDSTCRSRGTPCT